MRGTRSAFGSAGQAPHHQLIQDCREGHLPAGSVGHNLEGIRVKQDEEQLC